MRALRTLIISLIVLMPLSVTAEPLIRGLGPEPATLDPQAAQGLAALNVLRDLHEGLTTLDASGQIVPGLARDWSQQQDGLRYVFRLRSNLRWSDGSRLSASDFVRGLRHAVDPANAAPYGGLLTPIRNAAAIRAGELPVTSLGVKALDAEQLQIDLARPSPLLLQILAHPVSAPRPRSSDTPVYSGPYQLQRRILQGQLELQRNPHYYAAASVAMEQIHWLVTEEPASELSLFRAGEIHITETIPPGRYRWLQQNLPESLRVSPYLGTFFLAFNLEREPFANNLRLRQALSLVIDRATLTRVVTAAGEQPAYALVAPGLDDYPYPQLSSTAMSQEERLGLAKVLYRQAGDSEERPLKITLRYNTSTAQRRLAAAVSTMWQQYLGVATELINEEWKVFIVNRRQQVNTQIVRGGWIADIADPLSFLEPFSSDSSFNYTGYADENYQKLLKAAETAGSPDQRMRQLARAEARLMSQQPIIPLYYYVSRHLVQPRVRGYVDNPMDIHLSRYLSLAEQP